MLHCQLLKVKYQSNTFTSNTIEEQINKVSQNFNSPIEDAQWLVFTGESSTSTYNFNKENIYILFKNGDVKDISEVDNALINENLTGKVTKYYICYPRWWVIVNSSLFIATNYFYTIAIMNHEP